MAWQGSSQLTMCHNPKCQALYLASHVHTEEGWEQSPETHCPWCGQDVKESAAKNKGVETYGESEV